MSSLIVRLLPLALLAFFFFSGKEKITNIGIQARDIALEYKASIDIQEMVKMLRLSLIDEPRPPRDFIAFLEENAATSRAKRGIDPWGSEYQLAKTFGQGLKIRSCGPDRECGTDDDVEAEVRNEDGLLVGGGGSMDTIEKKIVSLLDNLTGKNHDTN